MPQSVLASGIPLMTEGQQEDSQSQCPVPARKPWPEWACVRAVSSLQPFAFPIKYHTGATLSYSALFWTERTRPATTLLGDRGHGPRAQAGDGGSHRQFPSTADSDLSPGLGPVAGCPPSRPRQAAEHAWPGPTRAITLSSRPSHDRFPHPPPPSIPVSIPPTTHLCPCPGAPQGQPWAPGCPPAPVPHRLTLPPVRLQHRLTWSLSYPARSHC